MENIDRIIHHPIFKMSMKKIGECEKNREFCCHGISHSLDVARMAYIVNLDYVHGLSAKLLSLADGREIPVSRSLYRKLKEAYLNHVF